MNYLRGFFSFYGRINRIQYAMVMLVGYDLGIYAGFANLIVVICVLFAAMAKRFHDIARSGFSSLLVCIPVAGMFTPFGLLFYPGDASDNRFGQPPRRF